MSAALPPASSAAFAQIDVDPPCAVERCILLVTGISLVSALVFFSQALFAIFLGSIEGGRASIVSALWFMSVYAFVKLCCRVVATRRAVVVALIVALLFYSSMAVGTTMMINWRVALFFWGVSYILWFATIRAFRAIRKGALDVFLAVARFKKKWAHNGSFMKHALKKGFSSSGVLYFCAALASVLLIPVVRPYLPYTLPPEFALVPIAWWCYRKGASRGLGQSVRDASEIPPGFTFYLRSFIDDAAEVATAEEMTLLEESVVSLLFSRQSLDSMLSYGSNLEEVAVAALWPFDPVLCLGRSSSQPLGALRLDVLGDDWQVLANRLLRSATRILLMISLTKGLTWELREVFSQRLQGKLILLKPPFKSAESSFRLRQPWKSIRDTPLTAIPTAQLESAIALRFSENGNPICLVSTSRTALAYAVALRVGCLPAAQLDVLSAPSALA